MESLDSFVHLVSICMEIKSWKQSNWKLHFVRKKNRGLSSSQIHGVHMNQFPIVEELRSLKFLLLHDENIVEETLWQNLRE